jgi:hypothetical protein
MHGVDVFTIGDGLIARRNTYIDGLSYQRQVRVAMGSKGRTVAPPLAARPEGPQCES